MILSQENITHVVQGYFKDKPVNEVYLFGSMPEARRMKTVMWI